MSNQENKQEETFSNVLAVAGYLKDNGWKIGKSLVYQHKKLGMIRPREDGLFYLSDIKKYINIARLENIKGSTVSIDDVQKRRNEAETRKMEAQAHHWEIKTKVAEGLYVPRDSFERELAQRAMVFKSDMEAFCRSKAAEIVSKVGGDNERIPDLIEFMLDASAKWLNRYAADREFKVPAPAAESILQDPDDELMDEE
ncbi:MAG: hypothetical protein ABFD50_19020 [Smithella sp.]